MALAEAATTGGKVGVKRPPQRGEERPVTLSPVVRDGITQSGALVRADQPWADAQLAELYDAFVFDGDLPLYLELAREHGRKVLEIACGSGRVLVPLARAGLMSRIASFDTAAFNGAFGRDLERRRQQCRALGLTQRQHALTVALPRYARKVAGVLAQQPLW